MTLTSNRKLFSFVKAFAFISLMSFCQNLLSENLTLYKLGVGDRIKIVVHGESDLTLETTLSDTGSFTYPFLGEVPAAGLSVEQLSKSIVEGLKPDYLIDPDINVSIVKYRQFFINGEVNSPGGYPFQPDLTLRKAVTLAGGFTDRASKSSISVIPEGSEDKNKQKRIDLEDKIKAGDIITVKQRFF